MRYTVALTGGIGSGKSTVADAFADLGITVIDADIIARQMVEPGQPALNAIAEHFGSELIASDGTLRRRRCVSVFFRIRKKKPGLTLCFTP
ncbi:Dephospho-CoA kinase [Salmonella enterica subsp. arizonae]|uniref:Dephospho-CoA kinase n=1 Tax=Salmonella enterica subsp. arizonae TaxID=59203 RepID=A0A3S4G600_SALER|nr:Dephospho-CoA kinase [Salmonella enterica subsp. arizonae]